MQRERLGGIPFEAKKVKKKVRLRFFPKGENPKGENPKNADSVVFTMLLEESDKEKILKVFE